MSLYRDTRELRASLAHMRDTLVDELAEVVADLRDLDQLEKVDLAALPPEDVIELIRWRRSLDRDRWPAGPRDN